MAFRLMLLAVHFGRRAGAPRRARADRRL